MRVDVAGKSLRLTRNRIIGQGGEAEVYAHGRNRVVKVFKQPDHPDFAASPELQAAVKHRLDEHQHKLESFPAGLPAQVIVPLELARDTDDGRIVGYTMRRIHDADPLYALKSPAARRGRGLHAQTKTLLELHDALVGLHRRGVVVGDLNDLNVLVSANGAFLIDADSYQFGRYACPVYSERFLDPRLEVANLRFSRESDWFAFAAMVVQTLLSVEPYGGVLARGSGPRVPQAQRPGRRLSIFNAPVKLPRPSLPPEVLSLELRAYLEDVFAADHRQPMPRELLADLRWSRCTSCGLDHAQSRCPHCAPHVMPPPQVSVGATPITCPARLAELRSVLAPQEEFWIDGRRFLRRGALGPEHVGDVLTAATRFWVGSAFGLGFYSAGRLRFGFVFDRHRRGLNDQVELEPLRGTLAAASCALSSQRAWLSISESIGPAIETRLTVVDQNGARVAHGCVGGEPWAAGLPGATAIGEILLVPTDEGVIRLEARGSQFVVAKTFAATSSIVDSATRLISDGRVLYALGRDHVFELSC